jgi:hypothetical protein
VQPLDISVVVPIEHLVKQNVYKGLSALLKGLSINQIVNCTLTFQTPPQDWKVILNPIVSNLQDQIGKSAIKLILCGPFASVSEEVKDFFLQYNVHLKHVNDLGNADLSANQETCKVINEFAERGFLIPIVWHVHQNNVNVILGVVDEAMHINYNSGFSLPLISHSPYYAEYDREFHLPQSRDYLKLLTEVYKKYPFYDDILFPLSAISSRCQLGGWAQSYAVPRQMNLILSPDGIFKLYMKIPSRAVPWKEAAELESLDSGNILPLLLGFYHYVERKEICPLCRSCQWKYLCAGELSSDQAQGGPDKMLCELEFLFLKAFLWQRWKAGTNSKPRQNL